MTRKKRNCTCSSKKRKEKIAYGFIDYIVNKLPEIHIPGYQYCGPGTKLEERLARGDPGINKLDQACKRHDIAYSQLESSKERRRADKDLISQAFPRVYSRDAKLGERAAALLVSGLMSAKVGLSKIGLGLEEESKKMKQRKIKQKKSAGKGKGKGGRRSTKSKKQKSITFGKLLSGVKANVKKSKNKSAKLKDTIRAAIRTAKHIKRNKAVKMPRILKLPKYGGNVLPILPILSVLGAIGNISSSAASVVKTIRSIEEAKASNDLVGQKKIGRGLYLTPNPNGSGFYLKPYQPGAQ